MKVLVIGSINLDIVNFVHNFPKIGETIESVDFHTNFGGKGANQAVALSKLSNDEIQTSMFAKIKNDKKGKEQVQNLVQQGVDVQNVCFSSKETGTALIICSIKEGNNKIIITKGANNDFGKKDFVQLKTAINGVGAILLQNETNQILNSEAIKIAHKSKKIIFYNPAPANGTKNKNLCLVDWLFVNEIELAFITKMPINNMNNILLASQKLKNHGSKNIIITLGAKGVLLLNPNHENGRLFPAIKTQVVDTTAAGDTFIGGFISKIIHDPKNIAKAIKFGILASSLTITKQGAQSSIPTLMEVNNEKNKTN